jgi:hypothetical protein
MPGINGGNPGSGGLGGKAGLLFGQAGAHGPNGTSGGGGGGSGVFSPYVDMTLFPQFDVTGAANAGIKNVTLAFVAGVSGGTDAGQPSWGGFDAYRLNGSQVDLINNQINAMRNAGIGMTISFGGATADNSGTDLAQTATSAAQLASEYRSFVDTYGIYKLDFDVEGPMQGQSSVLKTQALAINMLQQQETAAGHPIDVSYTLPVLPTGLVEGPSGGMNVLQIAQQSNVNVAHVNIMAMDYGAGFEGQSMGQNAIDAAQTTHSQLMTLYNLTSPQAYKMLDVTPMIGVNDITTEVFGIPDANTLTNFAQQNDLGGLSMWSANRDLPGPLGPPVSNTSSGVSQSPWEFSEIFETIEQG